MKRLLTLGCLAAALALPALPANAQQNVYTAKDVHLRAGPGRDYPVVAILRAGTPLTVDGCLSDYRWCDVEVANFRGWVYAGNIVTGYQGGQVPLMGYGAALGVSIVLFDLGIYWDTHYRSRPWYVERPQWINRPSQPHRPIVPRRPVPVAPAPMPGQPPRGHQPLPGQPPSHPQNPGALPRTPHAQPPVVQPPQGQPRPPGSPGRGEGPPPRPNPRAPAEGRGPGDKHP
jgi:uncharacterized protein YraI